MPSLLAHHSESLDVLRWLVLLEGGIVIGMALFVFRLYWFARQLALRRAANGVGASGVPQSHVAVLTVSHALLVLAQMVIVTERIGSQFVWYVTPLAAVAFTMSIYGLVVILRYENSRIARYLKPAKKTP